MTQEQTGGVFCRDDAARMLALLAGPGETIALRALKPEQPDMLFSEHGPALDCLARLSGRRPVYAVLNPLLPDCRALPTWKSGAKDDHIRALRWLPLDADPVRPPDTCSTDAELLAAKKRMRDVLAFLRTVIPDLSASVVHALSGNGAHALIRLPDYAPEEASRIKRLLIAINKRFTDDAVIIDRSVHNPARIWRAYGTMNVKGEDTPERPHRLARLLTPPDFSPVPLDLLAYEDALLAGLGVDTAPKAARPKRDASQEASGQTADDPPPLPPWWGEAVPAGGRNQAAFRRARWLLNATEGNQTEEAAWPIVKAWNVTCCRPTLDTGELRKAFDSARKGGDNPEYAVPAAESFALPSEPIWPEAAAEMFHGLAGDIVRAIEPHTEADPVALLVQTLAAFGSAIGRRSHFTAEADQHFGNLFAVLVGISSKGRKGTSWGHVLRLFASAEPTWGMSCVQTGLSSGEGLIWHVRDPIEKQVKDRKTGELMTVTEDQGIEDKRLLVQESEFAGVLRVAGRDGNTLSVILRDAWDRGRLQTMTKNSAARATGAHISLVGHVTADELRRELSTTEAGNGFANRFLWVCVRRSKELPEGGDLRDSDMDALRHRLETALNTAQHRDLLERDEGARGLWRQVYHDLSEGGPGLSGAVTSRGEAQTMRLALLYALLDGDTCIRTEHLMAALALWEYVEASARYIFGNSLGDPVADDILRALLAAPAGLSRNDLREMFKRHRNSERIGQALAVLMRHGLARSVTEETGGRPAERWYAVRPGGK